MNRALALSCNVRPMNSKGGNAGDKYREGKPVRVVRSHKCKEFAPAEGFRYDGLYKVKRYWPEKGRSGFVVWRYELIRDDPSPAPWTAEGKAVIKRKGYTCIMRDPSAAAGKKRKAEEEDEEGQDAKKVKKTYELRQEWKDLIKADVRNKNLWTQVLEQEMYSRTDLLNAVKESFECKVCMELENQQITLDCSHNICGGCLAQSIENDALNCPSCRADLYKNMDVKAINRDLERILDQLFPKSV